MKNKEEILNSINIPKELWFIKDNLIFLCLSGSRSYGTNTPESDWDFRGICIEPMEYVIGAKNFEQKEDKTNDVVIYGLKKFLTLAKTVNPNILDCLFASDDCIVYKHPIMDELLKNKHIFLSKKAMYTFSGYAYEQMHRMKGHKKWIDNPLEKPDRENMGLPICPIISQEKILALSALGREELLQFCKKENVDYIMKEVEYIKLKKEYDRYRKWKENRNEKRAELEQKHGIDTKHAMHLLRLLQASKEIAETGNISVKRSNCEFLMDIRNGKYSYEQILEMAQAEEDAAKALFEKSNLPYSINYEKIDQIFVKMIQEFHGVKW